MTVFVFGNEDLAIDSLPLRLLPKLKVRLPDIEFVVLDPNEEWQLPENLVIIDTVLGIKELKVFHDLEAFQRTPTLTMHDFDALANLRFLAKLGKIRTVKIIGLPPELPEDQALEALVFKLRSSAP